MLPLSTKTTRFRRCSLATAGAVAGVAGSGTARGEEVRQRHRPAVLLDLEIGGREVGDRAPLTIGHVRLDVDDVHAHALRDRVRRRRALLRASREAGDQDRSGDNRETGS